MSTEIIVPERQFHVWKYTIGHGLLLLRSTKSVGVPTRIDVLFKGVKEFHLPTTLKGLSITEAPEKEIPQLCVLRNTIVIGKGCKVFKVQGSDFLGYVIALLAVCHEDEGGYDDPSYFSANNII